MNTSSVGQLVGLQLTVLGIPLIFVIILFIVLHKITKNNSSISIRRILATIFIITFILSCLITILWMIPSPHKLQTWDLPLGVGMFEIPIAFLTVLLWIAKVTKASLGRRLGIGLLAAFISIPISFLVTIFASLITYSLISKIFSLG